MEIAEYIKSVNEKFRAGNATEHSYRGVLEQLMKAILPNLIITNEPKRVKCGAPDYIVSRKNGVPIFYIEAKDISDSDLDGHGAHKEQFDRYKQALDYIIFTDYLDFHFYKQGEFVDSVRIAEVKGDKVMGIEANWLKFADMIKNIGDNAIQRITSASRLARLMAGKARLLENIIEQAMSDDTGSYANAALQGQYNAFKNVLIHDLKEKDFADIYAQTIAYGMFAARMHDDTPEDFSREEAARLIPKTNPFLRQIFNTIAGNDLDDRIAWVVDDLVTVFCATDINKIMKAYGENKRHHDPMIHFYEDFLAEYNPALRKSKGVWYTPQPVVGFIVRAVDEILQREFGLADGLADYSMIDHEVVDVNAEDYRTKEGFKHVTKKFHRVQILDPATGTGTFLAEVINQIYDRYRDNQGIWQQYVEKHLLPRLNGFEILMASYAVAHLKLDMLLGETGYKHESENRLHVYLTNSLEESKKVAYDLFSTWLSSEANEASIIKNDHPVMVMIGNPPYSISSQNNGEWITDLIADYKKDLNERNMQPLSDDYIKFIRLGQEYISRTGEGILAFICNNSFIDGNIHRQMRKELMCIFDRLYILDLHGNARKKEIADDGSKDENVFDIMQGVSINIFYRTKKDSHNKCQVFYFDIRGSRDKKYDFLNKNSFSDVPWEELQPQSPYLFFVPKDFSTQKDYECNFRINDLMPLSTSGVKTHHDKDLISSLPFNSQYNKKYTYRPLDYKWIDYDLNKVVRHRYKYMKHIIDKDNISIIIGPQGQAVGPMPWNVMFVSKNLVDTNIFYRGGGIVFPLYLYSQDGKKRTVNFDKDLYDKIAQGLNYLPCYDDNILIDPTSEYNGVLYPQDLFDYIYAVLHSPSYRERYKEFLKIDFPRIPYPTDWEQFRDLAEKGEELRQLHLMEDLPSQTGVKFPVAGTGQVDCLRWQDGRVYINAEQYFEGVPESAWNFYIGGYQPAQKWLKDRKGRILSFEDVIHYGHIIYVLLQTERVMKEIDVLMKLQGKPLTE